MKVRKLASVILIAASLMAFSCKKENAVEAMINAIDKATEQLDKATTYEERMAVSQELGQKLQKIEEENPKYEFSDADKAKLDEALRKFLLKSISAESGQEAVKTMLKEESVKETTPDTSK